MIYLFPNKETRKTCSIVYKADHLTESQKQKAITIEELPPLFTPINHQAILLLDENEVPYWHYELIEEEEVTQ